MTDQFQESLREAFSDRVAQLNPNSIARLRAIDYHPRKRRLGRLPAFGALATAGVAGASVAVVSLGSSAAPAFAGWQSAPSTPAPGQLAQAEQACGQNLGSPLLTDSRGPYTATIYANSTTTNVCLDGNGVSMSSSSSAQAPVTVAAGAIELNGGGTRDSAGNALTLVDGRTGAGVTAVTIERSDASSVQATVVNGWYLAWWPGSAAATNAKVTSASGTSTEAFPSAPTLPAPPCPSGAECSSSYGFGGAGKPGAGPSSGGESSRTLEVHRASSSASGAGSTEGGSSSTEGPSSSTEGRSSSTERGSSSTEGGTGLPGGGPSLRH